MPDSWYTRRSAPMRFLPCPRCCKRFQEKVCEDCKDGKVPDAIQVELQGIVTASPSAWTEPCDECPDLNTTYVLDDYRLIIDQPGNLVTACVWDFRGSGSCTFLGVSFLLGKHRYYNPYIMHVTLNLRYEIYVFSKYLGLPSGGFDCMNFSGENISYYGHETYGYIGQGRRCDGSSASALVTTL